MKTVVIKEYGDVEIPGAYVLDLSRVTVKDCLGCWTCWWKTPGRCVHTDLNEFYREYINADKVIILSKVSRGFVSGNLKTLFDRSIPHYLPYTTYTTGETMHVPRYARYPDVEVYYQGEFATSEGRQVYEEYVYRTFYQFYFKNISVKPINEFPGKEPV